MNKFVLKSESGFATLIALLMVGMLTLLGIAALSTSDDEVNIAGNELQEMRAFYAAEAGLEAAGAALRSEFDSTGAPPTKMPAAKLELNECYLVYETVDDGPMTQEILARGTLSGLHASVKSFTVTAMAESKFDPGQITLRESFQMALIPIFQFAVFYNNELEFAPGPAMTISGRVHTNNKMYLQAGNNLTMDSWVTCAKDIHHGGTGAGAIGAGGDVFIKDVSGNDQNMLRSGVWLDSDHANWYDSSVARWGGMVRDQTHGQEQLNVPVDDPGGDPHKLIEPSAGGNSDSFEGKASLKIIDRTAFRLVGGIWVDVTADMVAKGIITFNDDKFYDTREVENVDVMDLDVDLMYTEGYGPANGVLYVSDGTSDFPAVRLVNGVELDAALTVASENPVYTFGDYNRTNKKPAAILADAITFLSDQWDDNKSTWSLATRNKPMHTTVNCSYIAGNVETDATNYSGGFENLPRFLEDWSSRNLNWAGSAVNLWNSVQADGSWGKANVYSAPNRSWNYDTDLDDPANMPPEVPVVRILQRVGWSQEFVSYYDAGAAH
ncbi:MAG: hypothetical protein OEV49_04380 [candidate division Zixibacteria bacterium]|nr:hypothetical protein [candidate division Zixibacteria bacterium]MDH3936168.1 hypothetical protein [candidate division Zixibacteria bacterium]MDH4033373.1 hypothetical protein [candidate division Zixibacteria bacterium]